MPISKPRRAIIQDFLKEKQIHASEWHCCDITFSSITEIAIHVNQHHQADIDTRETKKREEKQEKENNLYLLKQRRGKKVCGICGCIHCEYTLIVQAGLL